jgi:hypothetical protein
MVHERSGEGWPHFVDPPPIRLAARRWGARCGAAVTLSGPREASAWLEPLLPRYEEKLIHVLTVVAADAGSLDALLVSNAIRHVSRYSVVFKSAADLDFSVHRIILPCSYAVGSGARCVSKAALKSLLQVVDSNGPEREIFDIIASVSWTASQREPTVGRTCTVYVHRPDGTSGGLSYAADGTYGKGAPVDDIVTIMGTHIVRMSEVLQKLPVEIQERIGFSPGSGSLL